MEQLESLIKELMTSETLTYAIISNVRSKQETAFTKVTVKPVTLKQQLHYQFTFHYAQKVLHENYRTE